MYVCLCVPGSLCVYVDMDVYNPIGNKRLPDVGLWLKDTAKNWWKEKGRHIEVSLPPSFPHLRLSVSLALSLACCSSACACVLCVFARNSFV